MAATGTKSRETIYGSSVRASVERTKEPARSPTGARLRGQDPAHARLPGIGAAVPDAG